MSLDRRTVPFGHRERSRRYLTEIVTVVLDV